jgi:hypothetical protein
VLGAGGHHGGRARDLRRTPRPGSGPALFIFDSESGQITAWSLAADPIAGGKSAARLVFSSPTAVFKGLAIVRTDHGTFLYAANFRVGAVDVFNSHFKQVHLPGSTNPGS